MKIAMILSLVFCLVYVAVEADKGASKLFVVFCIMTHLEMSVVFFFIFQVFSLPLSDKIYREDMELRYISEICRKITKKGGPEELNQTLSRFITFKR